MFYVYRGINYGKHEVYYGVSKSPQHRIDGSHCVGATQAVRHWDCKRDNVEWTRIATYVTQTAASRFAHKKERESYYTFRVIRTAGI